VAVSTDTRQAIPLRPGLAGTDAVILGRLAQVVAMGRHSKAYTPDDVVRVAEAHLPNTRVLRRHLLNEQGRAERAEEELGKLREELRWLRARVQNLEAYVQVHPTPLADGDRRTVHLSPARHAILELLKTGANARQIAEQLGISDSAARNRVWRLLGDLGAHSQAEAVALIRSGEIDVRIKDGGQAAT
jgi:DNA-binding NarL/FixJ family response regulator